MTEYIVKIGFSLRAFAGTVITASPDTEAIKKARLAARGVMESTDRPEHFALEHRDDGVILFVDRVADGQTAPVVEDLALEPETPCRGAPASA